VGEPARVNRPHPDCTNESFRSLFRIHVIRADQHVAVRRPFEIVEHSRADRVECCCHLRIWKQRCGFQRERASRGQIHVLDLAGDKRDSSIDDNLPGGPRRERFDGDPVRRIWNGQHDHTTRGRRISI